LEVTGDLEQRLVASRGGLASFQSSQSTGRKLEAGPDTPDEDKGGGKEEAEINWRPSVYVYSTSAAPARGHQIKTQGVSWPEAAYASDNSGGSSACVEKPFAVNYTQVDDTANNAWKIKVSNITGGATITVHTGGSRNAITNPPTTEPEAASAVTDMKGYYSRGTRGAWHTEDASKNHEKYHYREWRETCTHYWPTCRTAIEGLSLSKATQPNSGLALAKLTQDADAKINSLKTIARQYWFTLGDGAGDRPYAAGQLTLNTAIKSVQTLAGKKGWTVEQGTDTPSTANPCYQAWLPYNP
jgi:hypothetical protein